MKLNINNIDTSFNSNIIVSKRVIPTPTNYVTFTSDSDMTITPRYTNTGYLFYSTDKINWTYIASGGTTTSAKTIYFAGKMNSARLYTSPVTSNAWKFNNATNVSIKGNLNTLLNYENPPTSILKFCYNAMFYQTGSSISDISELTLPATTLANDCYFGMFRNCGIISIPSGFLPATTLANNCYSGMFQGCTSLTTIPSNLLPATTLVDSCYFAMFTSCTSLVVNKASSSGYTRTFRIPTSGTGTNATTNALQDMFYNTASTIRTPSINTTYYMKN